MASQETLLQGLSLLFKLSDRTYSQIVEAPFSTSIGKEYHHILEHFHCVIRSLRSGEINYDTSEHNPRLETEATYAAIGTCDVLRAIKNYDKATLNRACKVVGTLTEVTPQPSVIETSIGRELAYCIGHAIHHYAIMRLMCSHLGIEAPPGFGIVRFAI